MSHALPLALSIVAVLLSASPVAAAEPMTLTTFAAGTGVEHRALVGARARFAPDGDKVWVHATLDNAGPARTVTLVWALDGTEKWRITLDVGTSPRWRTWARRTIGARDGGVWMVTALDPAGAVLGSTQFIVGADADTASAAR